MNKHSDTENMNTHIFYILFYFYMASSTLVENLKCWSCSSNVLLDVTALTAQCHNGKKNNIKKYSEELKDIQCQYEKCHYFLYIHNMFW